MGKCFKERNNVAAKKLIFYRYLSDATSVAAGDDDDHVIVL